MALSRAQKHLIQWLKLMDCSEDTVTGIMILLDTPLLRDKMMAWLCENSTSTEPEIFSKAVEIRDQYR